MLNTTTKEITELLDKQHYNKALKLINDSLSSLSDKEDNNIFKKELHFLLARLYYEIGENKSALKEITLCNELFKNIEKEALDTHDFINFRILYAKILRRNKKTKEAERIYTEILDRYEDKLDNEERVIISHNLANIYLENGKFDEAMKLFSKSLKLANETQNSRAIANTLSSIAALYYFMGKSTEAEKKYRESLDIFRKLNDLSGIATTCLNIGTIYANILNEKEAAIYLNEAIDLFNKLGHKKGVTTAREVLGSMYFFLMKYDKAISYLEHINELELEEIGTKQIDKMLFLAESYYELEENEQAELLVNKALKVVSNLEKKKNITLLSERAKLLQLSSLILVKKEEFDKALNILDELEQKAIKINDKESLIAIFLGKASVYGIKKEYAKEIEELLKARTLSARYVDDSIKATIDLNLFRSYILTLDYAKALKYLEKIKVKSQKVDGLINFNVEHKVCVIRTMQLILNKKLIPTTNLRKDDIISYDLRSTYFLQEVLYLAKRGKMDLNVISKSYKNMSNKKELSTFATYLMAKSLLSEIEDNEIVTQLNELSILDRLMFRIIEDQILFEELREYVQELVDKEWTFKEKSELLDVIGLGIIKDLLPKTTFDNISIKGSNKKEEEILLTKKNLLFTIVGIHNLNEYDLLKKKEGEEYSLTKVAGEMVNTILTNIKPKIISKFDRKKAQLLIFIITKVVTKTIECLYHGGLL